MRRIVCRATCGLLLLASQAIWAQTGTRVAPPAPAHVRVVGRPPGAGYIWTNGYYRWRGGRYVWPPGTWMRPLYRGAVWIQLRWVPRRGGWVFQRGYWR